MTNKDLNTFNQYKKEGEKSEEEEEEEQRMHHTTLMKNEGDREKKKVRGKTVEEIDLRQFCLV